MSTLARSIHWLAACAGLAATRMAGAAEPAANGEAGEEAATPAIASLPQYIAALTERAAEGLVAQLSAVVAMLTPSDGEAQAIDWYRVGDVALELAIVVATTLALFVLLRWLSRFPNRRLTAWCRAGDGGGGVARRLLGIVLASALNALAIAFAWVAGYAVALYGTGAAGEMATSQSLFLNAFLGIEAFKILLRVVFASAGGGVRLFPIPDADAAYWSRCLRRLVEFVGYGLLLVVPVVEVEIAPVVGSVISLAVLTVALGYALVIIHRNRAQLRAKLEARARASRFGSNRVLLLTLGRIWHWLAAVYFVALAGAMQVAPAALLPFIARATLQSLVALAVGLALYNALSAGVGRRLPLTAGVASNFPWLEDRLNAFVGPALHILRAAVAVFIVAVLLDAWSLFDLDTWIASEAGLYTLRAAASVAFVVVAAALVWIAFASWIDRRIGGGPEGRGAGARERTLLTLFRNAAAIVIIIMSAMIALSEVGIEIGPLLAGAGVLGLAVGFGAQSLVQDIITGVFIQLEKAINNGDVITVGGITGEVESLSIRSVGLRDLSGTFHIVPFSQVGTVSNYMRGFAYHLGEYRIAYHEDSDAALACLQSAFAELREDAELGPSILEDLEVHGVTGLADSSVNVRVRIKTEAGMQWSVGRAYNRLVKRHLEQAGIEIPYPRLQLAFDTPPEGLAPPRTGSETR